MRLIYVCLLLLSACSSLEVTIESDPAGAEVYEAQKREALGVTPLKLSSEQIEKIRQDRFVTFVVEKSGFQARQLAVELTGSSTNKLNLTPLDEGYFKDQVLTKFNTPINGMVREVLTIQGLLVAKRVGESETLLTDFEKKYPNVAATYVLLAQLARLKNDEEAVKRYLLRAQSIDATDPVAQRLLKGVQ